MNTELKGNLEMVLGNWNIIVGPHGSRFVPPVNAGRPGVRCCRYAVPRLPLSLHTMWASSALPMLINGTISASYHACWLSHFSCRTLYIEQEQQLLQESTTCQVCAQKKNLKCTLVNVPSRLFLCHTGPDKMFESEWVSYWCYIPKCEIQHFIQLDIILQQK